MVHSRFAPGSTGVLNDVAVILLPVDSAFAPVALDTGADDAVDVGRAVAALGTQLCNRYAGRASLQPCLDTSSFLCSQALA